MRRCRFAIGFALTVLACTDGPSAPAVEAPKQLSAASGTDSRANWTFADSYQSGTDALGNPIVSPTGIRSDGRGTYQGDVCGVQAIIFWYNTSLSQSGDATFDPDANRSGSCAARKLHFYLNGVKNVFGPSTNTGEVMQLVVGQSRVQQMGFSVAAGRTCERIVFRLEDGSGVKVTRTDGNTDPLAARSWSVESTGNHQGTCLMSSKGALVPSGTTYTLPFTATIIEVQP